MTTAWESWRQGYGVVHHTQTTQQRIRNLIDQLDHAGACNKAQALDWLNAADRLCNMGLWLTVHMTYADQVYLDGRPLQAADFKTTPEGHTGGALNMVPAYVGYLLANLLSGRTRAWLMGQGHCVAAIDAINILTRNLDAEQNQRYPITDAGLSRLCQDFYSYELTPDGRPAAPLGSHVNVYTAGGVSEGGYLGFAGLQYVHMPLPGQSLVAFLSDGAFEEQRGSDWTPRWWRGEDSGYVMPVMIANGRRIDQRTTMSQSGGVSWFRDHLRLNGFEPFDIDGRDPAAFAWAFITMEQELQEKHRHVVMGDSEYPVRLPYAIAETVKGYGFPGAGTNASHNLPLVGNPSQDEASQELFNQGCAALYVPHDELQKALSAMAAHDAQSRAYEKDHWLRNLHLCMPMLPGPCSAATGESVSPMEAIDEWFCHFADQNPRHRVRVGNPDEMRSNRMNLTLDYLKHRVTAPESGVAESLNGAVITALNEEAVVSAVLANKQGINLAVTYEAFGVKMLGAMRQEVIFARHMQEANREVNWLTVPVIVSSHTWENGKNEISHQDPTLAAAWLGEMSDVAPVMFPFDSNSAVETLRHLYGQRGRVAVVVSPKNKVPVCSTEEQAASAVRDGAVVLSEDPGSNVQLIAIGAYQLGEVQRAAQVLRDNGVACTVVAMVEPGRFRRPRDAREALYVHDETRRRTILPQAGNRIFVCHTHAEIMTGVLRPLDTGAEGTHFMGYRNRGGTLDVFGMLFANRQTWAHIVEKAADILAAPYQDWLSPQQLDALRGQGCPDELR